MSLPIDTAWGAARREIGKVVADDPDIELLAAILRERTGTGKLRDPERWHEARHMLKIIRPFLDRSGISDRLAAHAAVAEAARVVVALDADTAMPVNRWIERTRAACADLRDALGRVR